MRIPDYSANINEQNQRNVTENPKLVDLFNFLYLQFLAILAYFNGPVEFFDYIDFQAIGPPELPAVPSTSRLFYDSEVQKLKVSEGGNRFDILNYDGYYFPKLVDEFVAEETIASVGNLQWDLVAGNKAATFDASGVHPGVVSLTTNASSGARVAMQLNSIVLATKVAHLMFLVKCEIGASQQNYEFYIGLGDTANADFLGPSAIGFYYLRSGAGVVTLKAYVRDASVNTEVDISSFITTFDNWVKLELVSEDDAGWAFYVNDNLVAYIDTGIPNAFLKPMIGAQTNQNQAKGWKIDTFIETFRNLGVRYD